MLHLRAMEISSLLLLTGILVFLLAILLLISFISSTSRTKSEESVSEDIKKIKEQIKGK